MSGGIRLALAGDTMLGRGVADALSREPPEALFSDEVADALRGVNLFVLNLECCISDRGERWPDPMKPFFFRAPPVAVDVLRHLGVDCVTLANNHALDYGRVALLDTIGLLSAAGVETVGAGPDVEQARRPVILERNGFRLLIVGLTDHPVEYRADVGVSGMAYADFRSGIPDWVFDSMTQGNADAILVTPHWGPNMTRRPVPHVVRDQSRLGGAGGNTRRGTLCPRLSRRFGSGPLRHGGLHRRLRRRSTTPKRPGTCIPGGPDTEGSGSDRSHSSGP